MDIADLYVELGKADAQACQHQIDYREQQERQAAEMEELRDRHRDERVALSQATTDNTRRLRSLREAVLAAQSGVDPLSAKLAATGGDAKFCDPLTEPGFDAVGLNLFSNPDPQYQIGASPISSSTGTFILNGRPGQLLVNNGSSWVPVGPTDILP
jgi:hypothetical protein